jgi:glycosyltransferase involved in cell wall biosynthesis
MSDSSPQLTSVILPVFRSGDCLLPLYDRLKATLRRLDIGHEILFVEDCGGDGARELLLQLASVDPHVRVFKHRHNYGQHAAIATGLAHARGHQAIVMDADLQDPPEAMPRFLREADAGNDIVLSVRIVRGDSAFRSLCGLLVRRCLPMFSRFPNGVSYGSYFLIKRPVIDAYLAAPERLTSNLSVLDRLPGRFSFVEYEQDRRAAGESAYGLAALIGSLCHFMGKPYWEKRLFDCLAWTAIFYICKWGSSGHFMHQLCLLGTLMGIATSTFCAIARLHSGRSSDAFVVELDND